MKKIAVVIGVLAGVVVLGVVLAVVFVNSLVKKGVETVGPQITKVEMRLASANISVFSGKGTLKGMFIGNPEGYKTPSAMEFAESTLAVKPGSLMSDKIVVQEVKVIGPVITLEGNLQGNNLSKILDNVKAVAGGSGEKPEAKPAESKPSQGPSKKLQVDDLLISGAKVNVTLTMMGGKTTTVAIPDIHLTGLGSGPDGISAASLTEKLVQEILNGAIKAAGPALADFGKNATDAVKNLGDGNLKDAEKTLKGVGDLFKKK